MRLEDIKAAAEQLELDRAALQTATHEEMALDAPYYFILDVKEPDGEWFQSWYRHNSFGLVQSFAALYHAGRTCRISRVRREFPDSYTGVIESERVWVPADGYCGLTRYI